MMGHVGARPGPPPAVGRPTHDNSTTNGWAAGCSGMDAAASSGSGVNGAELGVGYYRGGGGGGGGDHLRL
jgi:hypothetical protein